MSDEIVRLIGDGDRASGGAIPLPDAFTAVIERLLDDGSASFAELNERVSDALAFKEARIMSSAWRSWEDFTNDILSRLRAIGVIEYTPYGRYYISGDFEPGKRYEAFPGSSTIGFTVHDKKTREQRDDNSKLLMELNKVVSQMSRFPRADEDAIKLLTQARAILVRKLDMLPSRDEIRKRSEQRINERRRSPRDPEGRVIPRSDMTAFAKQFWKDADQDTWYVIWDIADLWNKAHPDEPQIIDSNRAGPIRRVSMTLVAEGKVERRSVAGAGKGARFQYRKAGQHVPLSDTIVPVDEGKVRWEDPEW